MKRLLLSAFAVLVAASTAHAASITLTRQLFAADPLDPGPGDTVVLTVTATVDPGETAPAVFGELVFSGVGLAPVAIVTPTALQSFGGAITWVLGTNPCNDSTCTMINQIGGLGPLPVSNSPLVIATATFMIQSIGIVNANWDATTFDFFGAPPSAGVCMTCPIPEPATGSLVALGLLGLAAVNRRRA